MKLVCFVADSAAAALVEVHKRLGPDAVVVSVRQLRAPGLAWLWNRKGLIEVTAGVPDKTSAPKVDQNGVKERWSEGMMKIPDVPLSQNSNTSSLHHSNPTWRSVAWLEMMGLLPVHAERLQTHLRALHGDAPDSPEEEWKFINSALAQFWLNPPPLDDGPARPHVFIGPPGSGKTTFVQALAKELGVTETLQSPTYVLMKSYDIPQSPNQNTGFEKLVHIDAYRLENPKQFAALKPEQFLREPKTLVCIEWPERVEGELPQPDLLIKFSSEGMKESERGVEVQKLV